jgi:exosortase A
VAAYDAPLIQNDVPGQLNIPGHWRGPALLYFISCATAVVLFHNTLLLMVDTWYRSRTYSHCFLILPLFAYLVWLRRERAARIQPAPNYLGLPVLLVLSLVWLAGNLGEIRVVQEFALVAILITLTWTLLGNAVVRALAFPLFFLFFAVPFGVNLIRPLQDFTAWFVIHALTISNIPAVLENHILFLPSGTWTVAEACSGIRFLLSAVVLGTVFASLAYRSRKRQLLFMCASVVVPIIANGFRAYGTVLLAYLSGNRLAVGVDHIVYGAVFAVLIQFILIIIGLRWRENGEPDGSFDKSPTDDVSSAEGYARKPAFVAAAVALVVIALAPLAAARLWNQTPSATIWADPPVVVSAPWEATAGKDPTWAPLLGAAKEFRGSYRNDTNQVDLSWALYSGRQGTDLAATTVPAEISESSVLAADNFVTVTVGGRPTKVHHSLIESGSASRSVWMWYWVGGEYTSSRPRIRLLQAQARLLGKPATVAVIRIGADNQIDSAQAQRVLQEFLFHASFPVDAESRVVNAESRPNS